MFFLVNKKNCEETKGFLVTETKFFCEGDGEKKRKNCDKKIAIKKKSVT